MADKASPLDRVFVAVACVVGAAVVVVACSVAYWASSALVSAGECRANPATEKCRLLHERSVLEDVSWEVVRQQAKARAKERVR